MGYTPQDTRYDTMEYKNSGKSGLKLPLLSLGLWHNFGDTGNYDNMKAMCFTAFDNGITHFDSVKFSKKISCLTVTKS